jgi:hypothetical protein
VRVTPVTESEVPSDTDVDEFPEDARVAPVKTLLEPVIETKMFASSADVIVKPPAEFLEPEMLIVMSALVEAVTVKPARTL